MTSFDFVIVGAGSAGATLAARLSEDPSVKVALIEAGEKPPEHELMPAVCASLQLDPDTDWMFTGNPGKGGRGFKNQRMPVPRGKMLGGSSGINYMVWVRGHPGDYDNWAQKGAKGWGYSDVLPCFKRMEEFTKSNEIAFDQESHGTNGPIGVAVRSPVIPASRDFVAAANAAGIPQGDYNGKDRYNPSGVVSLMQTNTRAGKRSSTYHAYLENSAEKRANLSIITGATVSRLALEGKDSNLKAIGIVYRDRNGTEHIIHADKEVILSAGAVCSPHILMLSGIGPRRELEAVGITCVKDLPDVGKHLKDHVQTVFHFPAKGIGVPVAEVGLSAGPDAIRAPVGPLPADPAEDANLPEDLLALKKEAERRYAEWVETGSGLVSSSLYDGIAFFSTGLGDNHSHDGQIGFVPCGYDEDVIGNRINMDLDQLMEDSSKTLAPDAENIMLLASNAIPRSEGEIVLNSADASIPPSIDFNYFSDPYDLKVMVAIMRKLLDVVEHWPGPKKPGPWLVPPKLAEIHGYEPGKPPSDALLENFALHFAMTVYHLSCTCRMGDVVDSKLRVFGVQGLRVADASVMPEIVSGNINAATVMIGERAADIIAEDHTLSMTLN